MGVAARPVLWEAAALGSKRKAEDCRAKTIRIFPCAAAALSRSSKPFSRVRFPSARADATVLAKIGVKRGVFELAAESY